VSTGIVITYFFLSVSSFSAMWKTINVCNDVCTYLVVVVVVVVWAVVNVTNCLYKVLRNAVLTCT